MKSLIASIYILGLVGMVVETATIYAGEGTGGDLIEVRPFNNIEVWYEPANDWGLKKIGTL